MGYMRLFGYPTVRVRCKFLAHRGTALLFYTGTASALAHCGAATAAMMAASPGNSGHVDDQGDFYSLRQSRDSAGVDRYRLFRRMAIARAMRLPGVRQEFRRLAEQEALYDAVSSLIKRPVLH